MDDVIEKREEIIMRKVIVIVACLALLATTACYINVKESGSSPCDKPCPGMKDAKQVKQIEYFTSGDYQTALRPEFK